MWPPAMRAATASPGARPSAPSPTAHSTATLVAATMPRYHRGRRAAQQELAPGRAVHERVSARAPQQGRSNHARQLVHEMPSRGAHT